MQIDRRPINREKSIFLQVAKKDERYCDSCNLDLLRNRAYFTLTFGKEGKKVIVLRLCGSCLTTLKKINRRDAQLPDFKIGDPRR